MNLTNSQYEQLMSIYYRRQNQAKREENHRLEQVIQTIPEFSELNRKAQNLSLEYTKAMLQQGKANFDLNEELDAITKRKEALLLEHGFPKDYLQPIYYCKDCQDTGYIGDKKCHCFEKEIVNFLYSQSNIAEILEQENFDHFDLSYYPDDYIEEMTEQTPRDNMRGILEVVKQFLADFDNTPGNLLLYGNTGVGKTFLTNCIAKELLDRSHTVVYLTSLKLFDILETYKFDKDLSATEKTAAISYILDSDLLIIDDLGTELNNSFTSSQLYHCIDTRLNRRRSTVISTNLSFQDLKEEYSERIFSRLTSNYTLLKLTGDDIRLKKAIMQ
ncbi:MAG: ATP-binding protein [Eubacterium sp.]|nr:ATP-binding protein [Eubacterium sp.]